jgi:hypothetical protein
MSKIIIYTIIFLGVILGYVKYIELRAVFFPSREIEFTPSSINLSFEDIWINTSDNLKINAWFIPYNDAKYCLLFLHGNAGNIGNRLDKIQLLRQAKINILIIDYRGYGRSEGQPFEKGLYLDAQAAYNYLVNRRKIKPEQIILYGESLGTAVVVNLASETKVGAVILEGAFSKGRDMAKRSYPFLPTPLFSNKFDSLAKIKKINAPKLFMHSQEDEIVPFDLAQKLYDAANEPKQLVALIGGHNSAFLDSQEIYVSSINLFIERL